VAPPYLLLPTGVALTASQSVGDRSWIAAAHELVPSDDEWYLQANATCAAVQ
jgi:hypothetical protein